MTEVVCIESKTSRTKRVYLASLSRSNNQLSWVPCAEWKTSKFERSGGGKSYGKDSRFSEKTVNSEPKLYAKGPRLREKSIDRDTRSYKKGPRFFVRRQPIMKRQTLQIWIWVTAAINLVALCCLGVSYFTTYQFEYEYKGTDRNGREVLYTAHFGFWSSCHHTQGMVREKCLDTIESVKPFDECK